jgi:hypothetical protein
MILQAATETVKSTSSLALDGVAIMALITAGGLAAREYFKSRRGRANGNNNSKGPKPGTAPECQAHRDKLIELDTEQKNTKELLGEVRTDVKTLLQRIPPRE